jgi:hypothetical protein
MKQMKHVFAIVFLLLCGLTANGKEDLIDQLRSKRAQERLDAAELIVKERTASVEKLLLILAQEDQAAYPMHSPAEVAARLLGKLGAREAVPALIMRITLPASSVGSEELFWRPPCVDALVQIGSPAIEGIVERVKSPATDEEMTLFAEVLRRIDGNDLAIVRVTLLQKKQETEVLEKNLQKILDLLKKGK